MKKYLSILLTVCLIVSAIFVPMNVIADETTNDSGYFFTDFSNDDFKLFEEGEAQVDSEGNEFYPFSYHSYYADERTTCKTELVTLTDNNNEEKTLLDIKSQSTENGKFVSEVVLVPTDKEGNPFVIDNNSKYKVEYKFYVKNVVEWRNLGFGRGPIHSYTVNGKETLVSGNTTSTIEIPYNSMNYQYDSTGKFEERTSKTGWLLPNGTNRVNITYNNKYTAENWYDKPLTGSLMFETDEYDVVGNKFDIIANDGTSVLTFDNYFAIYLSIGYSVDVPAEVLFDYVKVTKVIENVTFDANGGTVNNSDSAVVTGYAGDLLPVPVRSGDWVFDGWTFEDGTAAPEEYSPALTGKKLYAKWSEGVCPVVYDFDHNEIINTSGENKKILGADGVEYSIGSWCFQTIRANSKGLGRNGSYGLRCGAGDQTWGVNGCYPINDGTNFYYLEPNTCYTVTLDVNATEVVDREVGCPFHLVYGPYYSGSGWSTDSKRYQGVLTNIVQYEKGVATYPDAAEVVEHDDGWKTLTFKFTTPVAFPSNEASFPFGNILAIYGNWTKGITMNFDNIIIEKAPAVNFVLENGTFERQNYFVGDKVVFPESDNTSKDVYFEDGTGYTTFGFNWYTDADCTKLADTENTVVSNKNLTFYQKNNTLIDFNDNQVSYFGFENDEIIEGFANVNGGYESLTAGKAIENYAYLGNGSISKGVTYKLTMFYKSASNVDFEIHGLNSKLNAANNWTKAEFSFVAKNNDLIINFNNVPSELIIDTIVVSKVAVTEGFSILTSESEATVNKQAIRAYFGYNAENNKVTLNGSEFDVVERGIIFASALNDGELTLETENTVVVSKDNNFENCWNYEDGKITFSAYVKDFGLNDKRELYAVGYVKLSDGVTYYSEVQNNSVDFMKKEELYKTETNTYSLLDQNVLDNVVLNQRYDKTANGVTFDWTASTLKYKSLSKGETTVNLIINNVVDATATTNLTCSFKVMIDGVLQPENYSVKGNAGDKVSFTFNVGEELKERVIEVTRVNERGICILDLVDFTIHGELLKTEEQDILIEFIGDSVTCAGAMGGDGLQSYAYRTAHALGTDFRMVSQSGTGLMYNSGGEVNDKSVWTRGYKYENYMRSKTTMTTYDRIADIVVINVGTNDVASRFAGHCSWTNDDFVEAGKSLIATVKSYNPDAIIVWCTKGMEGGHTTAVNMTIEALGGPENGYYVCDFKTAYHDGSDNWHPGVEGHKSMSATMIEWFNQSGILD